MTVLIINYGMGNLGSARRSFEECGAQVLISEEPADVKNAERIVIPGVGAFAEAMRRLQQRGWDEVLREAAFRDRLPLLGICLGMQLLAAIGEEGQATPGLALVAGRVVRLSNAVTGERIPHVGWNEVYPVDQSDLFHDIPPGSDFYFVHSYHFMPDNPESILANTPYCGGFVSAVRNANVFGVQFHPEKSSKTGFQLIRNFLKI